MDCIILLTVYSSTTQSLYIITDLLKNQEKGKEARVLQWIIGESASLFNCLCMHHYLQDKKIKERKKERKNHTQHLWTSLALLHKTTSHSATPITCISYSRGLSLYINLHIYLQKLQTSGGEKLCLHFSMLIGEYLSTVLAQRQSKKHKPRASITLRKKRR